MNDYRDDLDYYSDKDKQTRRPNVEAVRLYLRIEEDRCTIVVVHVHFSHYMVVV